MEILINTNESIDFSFKNNKLIFEVDYNVLKSINVNNVNNVNNIEKNNNLDISFNENKKGVALNEWVKKNIEYIDMNLIDNNECEVNNDIDYYDLMIYNGNIITVKELNLDYELLIEIYEKNNKINLNNFNRTLSNNIFTYLLTNKTKDEEKLDYIINNIIFYEYNKFKDYINKKHNLLTLMLFGNERIHDKGYYICKINKNDSYFKWSNGGHKNSSCLIYNSEKIPHIELFQFMIYLSDYEHEIIFLNKKMKLNKGDTLFFPANMMYPFKIDKCNEDIYFLIGYMYF